MFVELVYDKGNFVRLGSSKSYEKFKSKAIQDYGGMPHKEKTFKIIKMKSNDDITHVT